MTDANSGNTIANVTITTNGGYVLIVGTFRVTDFIVSSNAQAEVALFRAGATEPLQRQFAQIRIGSATPIVQAQFNMSLSKIDRPSTGVNCYFVRAVSIPGSALADWRQLSAIEIKM